MRDFSQQKCGLDMATETLCTINGVAIWQIGKFIRERSEALAISYRPRSQYRVSFIRDLMVLLYVNEIPTYE